MTWIFPLIFLILFEAIADIFSKEYSLKGNHSLWIFAILFYLVCNAFWLLAIRNGSGLVRGANIFSVSSAVVATIIGMYMYHEKLSTIQFFGIALGIASLILLFSE